MLLPDGSEKLDDRPVAVPLNFKPPKPLNEKIREIARYEASLYAQANGQETFEEADDFNIPDDPIDPTSPWEEDFDKEVPFVGAKEDAIRHGITEDLDESKIHKAKEELDRLQYKRKPQVSKKASSKNEKMSEAEGEQDLPLEQEEQ